MMKVLSSTGKDSTSRMISMALGIILLTRLQAKFFKSLSLMGMIHGIATPLLHGLMIPE
jgi:hypothetical protein